MGTMATMRAAVCVRPGSGHVELQVRPAPALLPGQARLGVRACGVCRTDLHVVDGELPQAVAGIVPGHEIVGEVIELGAAVQGLQLGQRVGVPWLGGTCGVCDYCRSGRENLCAEALFTGCTLDGGYAEQCTADARFCLPLPESHDDAELAPLLCAGLIGHRAHAMCGPVRRLGLYGFGAAAHILAQTAAFAGTEVFALTRRGDTRAQQFARSLGCVYAGGSDQPPPLLLDAAIVFAPVGELVVQALRAIRPGGRVVCAGIHMSDVPSFPYALLWQERSIGSVANLTRADGVGFFDLVARCRPRVTVQRYRLADADRALDDLRHGNLIGAAVLLP